MRLGRAGFLLDAQPTLTMPHYRRRRLTGNGPACVYARMHNRV